MRHYLFILLWVNVMAISAHPFQQNNIELRDSLVQYAKTLLNTPYRSGSKGPNGFDCSGFTHYVFQRFGVLLGESSRQQVYDGNEVATDQLKKGDLVFFKGSNSRRDRIGHVGIVIGHNPDGGFNFIHAAYDGGVRIDNSLENYYAKRYVTGCCVLAHDTLYHYHAVEMPSTSFSNDDNASYPVQLAEVIDHRVRRGESLYLIAHKYQVSEEQLKEWNHLKSNEIKPGQKLILKKTEKDCATSADENTTTQETRATKIVHRVKRGESLYTIARKYHVSEAKLKAWNHLSSNEIKPGKKLILNVFEKHYAAADEHVTTTNPENTTQEPNSREIIHSVKSKETLLSIAKKYHVTTRNLKEWNHLHSNRVKKGTKLIIKVAEKKSADTSTLQVGTTSNNRLQPTTRKTTQVTRTVIKHQKHRIRSGESLYTIAREYHTTVAKLKRLNHLSSTKLKPGKIITVGVRTQKITSESTSEISTINNEQQPQPAEKPVIPENRPGQTTTQEEPGNPIHSALTLKNDKEASPKNVQLDTLYSSYLTTEKHIVQPGETFASIADKYHVTEQDVKAWNGIPRRQKTVAPGKELLLQVTKKAFVVVSKPIHSKKSENKQPIQSVQNQEKTTKPVADQEHIVKKGESLYSIANQHLRLTPNTTNEVKNDTLATEEYIVKPGDTLSSVAKAHHVTIDKLKELNQLIKNDLNIGQQLIVPVYPAK